MNRMNTLKRTCGLLLTGAAVWLAPADTAHAQKMVKTETATFRNGDNGYTGMQDTCILKISGGYTDYNYGGATRLDLGDASSQDRRMLFRFNLAGLAGKYSSIERLTLIMKESPDAGSTRSGAASAYRIKPANKDWVEGTKNGATEEGSPCWSYKAWSASSPTSWAGSAGLSSAGTDYDATPLGTFTVNTTANQLYALNLAPADASQRKSLVDEWSGNQADNAGIVIFGPANNPFYAVSSAHTTTNSRPQLVVEYVPAGPPVAVFQAGADGYAGAADGFVLDVGGWGTNLNYGAFARLDCSRQTGDNRASLLRFDLRALGKSRSGLYSSIERLTLNFRESGGVNEYTTAGTGTVYRILPANKEWVEGTGNNHAPALEGEPCWSYKAWSATSPTAWAGSAGLSSAGTDYDAAALGSFAHSDTNQQRYSVNLADGDAARRKSLVEEWSGNQADNAGMLLRESASPSQLFLYSREGEAVGDRPALEVAYTATETKTKTFQNGVAGYAGMQDTSILNVSGGYADRNFGKSPRLDGLYAAASDIRKVLMRFDLSSLRGRYAAIRRVRLTLTDSELSAPTFSGTLRAYRVKAANKGWVEGTATGTDGAANAGEPCWNYKAYSATSPTNWAGSAGLSTAGTDYEAVELGSVTGVLSMGGSLTLELGNAASLVDEWSGDQSDNAGILLAADANNLYGCSSEHATAANRPLLEVEYVPIKGTLIRFY